MEETGNPRFPVRIAIEEEGKTLFAVRAQEAWPGAKGNVFCIRDGSEREERDLFREVERVPIVHFERFGKSIQVVLDRSTRKRCEFLVLERKYKNKEGSYEQIFFKTQAGISAHKSRSRVALPAGAVSLHVVIDTAERYPWKFPKAKVERRKLPCGDYALVQDERICAVVERKTFDNLLSDFGNIAVLHQGLRELTTYSYAALVIESDYGDFLNPKRLAGRWPPSHGYRVLSELQAMHPSLPIIFAGTRKEANLWTYGFFRAVTKRLAREAQEEGELLTAEPLVPFSTDERLESRILQMLKNAPEGMTVVELAEQCLDADAGAIRKVLLLLKKRGLASCTSRGAKARWVYMRT